MEFSDFFRTLHGYAPFPWQARMATAAQLPDYLDIPTGLGKTAVIDVWAWRLLNGCANTPRRLLYVVDRRLVVDSVFERACLLADRYPDDLHAVRLRGGMTLDESWVADPARPAIIVSTVDQVGSRLLFRGYGLSHKVAPIHAALVGNDALIVLDEAHLSQPFSATLRAVRSLRGEALPLPWQILEMTATPPAGTKAFGLLDEDRGNSLVKARLEVSKPAELESCCENAFTTVVVRHARRLREQGADVVAVVVNRVRDARAVYTALSEYGEALLLIGRIRAGDRDRLLASRLRQLKTGSRAVGRLPLFVVATQTIEVGADLDFDALVTESATMAALRQRFGRLGRAGDLKQLPAVVVHRKLDKDQNGKTKLDPVYGKDRDTAWKWLEKQAKSPGKKQPKQVDFGIEHFALLDDPPQPEAETGPLLSVAHLDVLAQTSVPLPVDLAPYLHGWQRSMDVGIVWRDDLDPNRAGDWAEKITLVPPRTREVLSVPLPAACRWLARSTMVDVGDIEGAQALQFNASGARRVLRWGETPAVVSGECLRAGDLIVVPAAYGGCDAFGWYPESVDPVEDLGDLEQGRVSLRITARRHPEIADILENLEQPGEIFEALSLPEWYRDQVQAQAYPGGVLVTGWDYHRDAQTGVKAIALDEHRAAVAAAAEQFARRTGLPEPMVGAVGEAGRCHDLGKADLRWQAAYGGSLTTPLAKGRRDPAFAALLPKGWRHEMESVRRTETADGLVRHLIGTHHGHGRPLFPALPDPELWHALGGLDWAEQFSRLQAQYGHWGLAYLETLLRLADWLVSDQEQES